MTKTGEGEGENQDLIGSGMADETRADDPDSRSSDPSSTIDASTMLDSVVYQIEPELGVDEFLGVLERSTLAERRPVDESETIRLMLRNADVIATARIGGKLVGVSRAITDFAYCTYLSDLAVDLAHQRRGIGRELVRRTHEVAGFQTTLILLAAPGARTYYPRIGMAPHDSCWVRPRTPGPRPSPA